MKVHCPAHEDDSPSMHLYEDKAWCFVCNYSCPVEDIVPGYEPTKKEPEDVRTKIEFIRKLPNRPVRGLRLHQDNEGFYILWPSLSYYKKRLFSGKPTRYLGPRGIRAPLFTFEVPDSKSLILVEGELNAISLRVAYPNHKVVIASPGSCAEFSRHYKEYLNFQYICIIVDYDNPGVGHGLALKQRLLKDKKNVELIAMSPDYNDILQSSGVDGVQKEAEKQGLVLQ